jgi:hypothetical protein
VATRDEVVQMAREQADAEGSSRWTPEAVLAAVDLTFLREWNTILASAPYARTNVVTVSTDVNGVLPFSSLTTGTGDARRIFRNLIQLSDGINIYLEGRVDMIPPQVGAMQRFFYDTGTAFQIVPEGVQQMRAVVNWRPVAPLDLVDGNSIVDFPEDGTILLAMGAAAVMLAKGGAETGASAALLNLSMQIREDMLSSIRRRTNMPKFMRYPDTAGQWAGQ